jgi:hypothetical protein
MALFISEAANSAHRAHQAGASCAGSLAAHSAHCHQPNWSLQGTLIRTIASAMPSARP